jgi:hypothetical protein
VCALVLAVPTQLPKLRRNDVGAGTNGRSYDGVSVGSGLRSGTQTLDAQRESSRLGRETLLHSAVSPSSPETN